jgi:hypothetical protein
MGPYGFCLALGATGLAVMAFLGFSHHAGAHSSHHDGGGTGGGQGGLGGHGGGHPADLGHAAGHGAGHGHELGHGAGPAHDVGHGGHAGHAHAGGHGSDLAARLTTLLSPRALFSMLVGAGATGVLVRPVLFEPLVAALAVLGGYLFERGVVRPAWNFLFRFESRQALTLESAVMEEAVAVTDFDARGDGLVQLELDGQLIQILGSLRPEDRGAPRRVRRGDRVLIEDVDVARNRCTVSFAGELKPGEAS